MIELEAYATELKSNFGQSLRRLRQNLNLTQADLAAVCRTTRRAVSDAERGQLNLAVSSLAKYAVAVGSDVPTMLTKQTEPGGTR
jgi:transcriptional regulator with XRE-family HTH domain